MSITKGEEILLSGLSKIAEHLGNKGLARLDPVARANTLIDATLNMYEAEGMFFAKPVQWNPGEYNVKRPLDWHEEGFKEFHSAVRGTTYTEVHELLGTVGCSPMEPYWVWSVLGVITTPRGKLVVCPNDWILEPFESFYIVMPDDVYRKHFKGSE